MRTTYRAVQCRCLHPKCRDWHVDPVATIQGVHFTSVQAHAVATFLNTLEEVREVQRVELGLLLESKVGVTGAVADAVLMDDVRGILA